MRPILPNMTLNDRIDAARDDITKLTQDLRADPIFA
jgi:hypothetical protein